MKTVSSTILCGFRAFHARGCMCMNLKRFYVAIDVGLWERGKSFGKDVRSELGARTPAGVRARKA